MKKAISIIAVFAVFLLSVSAHTERVFKAAEGFKAPMLKVVNDEMETSLDDLRGSYVLINFWASTDAVSRVAAGEYDAFMKSAAGKQIRLLSVNVDRNERLFKEIVRRDGLDEKTQYYVGDTDVKSIDNNYFSGVGLRSYLVNPQGDIVATNPSTQTLASMMAI